MPTSDGEQLDPITRLDNEQLDVVVYDENDVVKDITTDRLVFEARLKVSDVEPLISKTSDDSGEISKTNAAQGRARIFIVPEDTAGITKTAGVTLQCVLKVIDVAERTSSILFQLPVKYRL